jgi:hypothetical protein
VANTELNLLQKFGRFLMTGALVFTILFWGTSMVLMSAIDARHDISALRIIIKSCIQQPFAMWLRDLEAAYIPFFLLQRPLMACYLISASFAWIAAFFYDGRILRKENTL